MNSPIKKAYIRHKYTKGQILELQKCKRDPKYFIENYCTVIHPVTAKEILFKLYSYQHRLIDAIESGRLSIALFGRQMGKTETLVSYMLWFAMFHSNRNVLIAAHKFEHVGEIMRRLKHVYEGLPFWLKAGVMPDGYNARSVKFDNNSMIQGVATTPNAGRGKTIHLLYIDEMSSIPTNMSKEFWASIQPTLATSRGKCIITSTPSADDDEFAQIWHGAINTTDEYGNTLPNGVGRNGFKSIFAQWDEHPARNEQWKDEEYAAVGDERFRREHLCQFISFEETLIDPIFLNEQIGRGCIEPVYVTGTVRWYDSIKPNKTYIIGLDPSVGSGGDPAAIQIYQLPEFIQVGEWRHNKTPAPGQVRILMQILHYIYNAMTSSSLQVGDPELYWSVENNTIGEAALVVINETGEENFPGIMLTESKRAGNVRTYRKGFNTTNKKKLEACSRLKALVESKKLKIHSRALTRELKFFVAKGVSYEAKTGETDDLIMATLLVIRMLEELLQWDGDLQQAITEKIDGFEDGFLEPMPSLLL